MDSSQMEVETYVREIWQRQMAGELVAFRHEEGKTPFQLHENGTRLRIDGGAYSVRATYVGADDRAGKNPLRHTLVIEPIPV
jgi:hypothetical protein